jgi:hypothetical protein
MFSEEVIAPQTNRTEKFGKSIRKPRFFPRGRRSAKRRKSVKTSMNISQSCALKDRGYLRRTSRSVNDATTVQEKPPRQASSPAAVGLRHSRDLYERYAAVERGIHSAFSEVILA